MIVKKIRTAQDQWSVRDIGGGRYRRFIEILLARNWQGATPDWEAKGDPVHAFIIRSDWVLICPDCGEQFIAQPDEPYYCHQCQNIINDGKARPVKFPDNRTDIDKVLLERPIPDNRNWNTGETLQDLLRENVEHGISLAGFPKPEADTDVEEIKEKIAAKVVAKAGN